LTGLKQKSEVHRRLEQGQIATEEYTDVASTCRNGAKTAKAYKVETSKGAEQRQRKWRACECMGGQRMVTESVSPLLCGAGDVVKSNREKAEVLMGQPQR